MTASAKSIRAIFDEACEIAGSEERREFVAHSCKGDSALHREVEELLSAREKTGGFLADTKRGASARFSLKEGDQVARYKLIQKIGEGGCGVVFRAEQIEPVRRQVALKVIKLGMDTRAVIARFEAERQALALMDHPGIARVLDAGATETGRPFFVMELVSGKRITEFCEQNSLSTVERLKLFILGCQAVQHAHQKGIIHRDLKPSNVLVTSTDGVPLPKVIDFGIAKATADVHLTDKTVFTRFEMFLGTPAYMSPEQAELNATDLDTRTDIYSLGVLLYELLTGRPPFETETWLNSGIDALRKAIREKEPARPSSLVPKSAIPSDLDWIVLKAMEKDRARRYQTANALATDIQRHLQHEPVVARPPSPLYLLQKSVRRNRPAFLIGVAIALLLITGVVFTTRDAVRTRRAEKVQRELREKAESNQRQAELARNEADAANHTLQRSLLIREWQDAENLLDQGKIGSALAWFARTAREHPGDLAAQTRLLSLLTEGNFVLPADRALIHDSPVNTAAFLSDGQHLATAAKDGLVRIWELNSVSNPLILSNEFQNPMIAAVAGENRFLVNDARSVSVWNLNRLVKIVPFPHEVSSRLAVSKDGRMVAIHRTANILELWDTAELKPVAGPFEVLKVHPPIAAFTSDGKYFLACDKSSLVCAWEISSGRQVWRTPRIVNPRGEGVIHAEPSPDGTTVLETCWLGPGGELWGWTFEPGSSLAATPAMAVFQDWVLPTRSPVVTWCFSKGGNQLYAGDAEGHLGIMNLSTRQLHLLNAEHDGRVTWIGLSSSGEKLATASTDGSARLWDVRMRSAEPMVVTNGTGIWDAKFSPDSRWFVCAGSKAAEIRDAQSASLLRRLPVNEFVTHLDISPDGRRVLTGTGGGQAAMWDAHSGAQLFSISTPSRIGIEYTEFSPDGDTFLIVYRHEVAVRESETGRQIGPVLTNDSPVVSAHFNPNGTSLVVATVNGPVEFWSLPHGRRLENRAHHKDVVWTAQFSSDGKFLVTSSRDRTAALWDADTGARLVEFRHDQQVYNAAFNPEASRIVTGDAGHKAHIWDAKTGQRLFSLPPHPGGVWYGEFSSDGRILLTGDDAGNARLWEASSGLPMSGWIHNGASLKRTHLSPDGRKALSAAQNGTLRLWPVVMAPLPAPSWLPDLAEAVAGNRLRADGSPETVSAERWQSLSISLSSLEGDDFYARWSHWFFRERLKDHPAPFVP